MSQGFHSINMAVTYFQNLLRRIERRRSGSLPYGLESTVEQLKISIGNLTSDDVIRLNDFSDPEQTTCACPQHVLGYTTDGKIAYYGLNHIGADDSKNFYK